MTLQVRFGHRTMDFPSAELGELHSSHATEDMETLHARMRRDGYLLLRGLMPRDAVMAGRAAVLHHMDEHEALTPGEPVMEGVMPRSARHVRMMSSDGIVYHPDVQRVLESPELFSFFARYFEVEAATFAYKWMRAVGNEEYTGAHYDFVYMGRGSGNLHTVWIPFGDVPVTYGTLCVCEGSNHLPEFSRIRDTYGRLDVDRDRADGWFTREPMEITEEFGGRWLTSEFQAGDVILFGMHTMHASTTNLSNRYRLSCDVRYQPQHEPMDERWRKNGIGHRIFNDKEPLRTMEDLRHEWGV